MTHWTDALVRLKACRDAVDWSRKQPDPATAWRECKRGDWMLWLLGKLEHSEPWSDERKRLVRCAVECAAEAEPYEGDGEAWRATAECRRVALAWTRGEATREDVIAARNAAVEATAGNAAGFAAAYAADAADAAAYAVATANADANAAADAAANVATTVATYAAYAAFDVAERDYVLARCADIVRLHYPDLPAIKGGDR
jgi:hypothetical protein